MKISCKKIKVVLLPGMDGTGLLFDDLIKYFPDTIDYTVYSFTVMKATTYTEQAEEIAKDIGDDNVLLIGESYSGRIVYELCHILGAQVKQVVFLASFISKPSLVSSFAFLLPLGLLNANALSTWLVHFVGFNLEGDRAIVNPVFNALTKTDKSQLKQRLNNIAQLTAPQHTFDCPTTYIQASIDRLVSKQSLKVLQSVYTHCKVVKIDGGHFIAQAKPSACAKIICECIDL